jgi:hypothetical protein
MEKEKSKEKDLMYPLKLWLLTLFIAAILFSLWSLLDGGWNDISNLLYGLFSIAFWILCLGLFFGLPALIVIWPLYRGYILFTESIILDQIITVIVSIISVIVSFRLFLDSPNLHYFSIPYILAIPIAGTILYIRQSKKRLLNQL